MITRTIETTVALGVALNKTTREFAEFREPIPKRKANKEDAERYLITKGFRTLGDEYILVCVNELMTHSELYGITEELFLQHAILLNPDTRKPYENEKTEDK